MKRKLLSIAALLLASALHAQVGIGTTTPNKSAELTLFSKDKGVLIPTIALKSTVDKTTITNGNVESLLVYANVKQGDITPGFYYWNSMRWVRIASDVDITDEVINNFTTIINNEHVLQEIEQIFQNLGGGNVYYDGTTFSYTDSNGTQQVIDLTNLVKANETLTTLVDNNDGIYTYTSENGTETIINVPQSVIEQFETIFANETVKNEILQLVTTVGGGNVYYDGTTFSYTDNNGTQQAIDLANHVKAHETLTTLVNNNDGTYTYTSENGTETIINVPQSVIEQFETIITNETVRKEIEQIVNLTGGNVYYDGDKLEYIDSDGEPHEVNLTNIIRNRETITKLVKNNNGTLTYYNEKEINEDGDPIANTGVTFKEVSSDVYGLTQTIQSGTSVTRKWNYENMVARSTVSSFYYSNANYETIYTTYFDANSNPPNSKYLNISFGVFGAINTINDFVSNLEVFANVEAAIYVNNVEVKKFIGIRYLMGGLIVGLNWNVHTFSGVVTFPSNLTLTPTNNKIEIKVRPYENNFNRNLGSTNGTFRRGLSVMQLYVYSSPIIQVFQKQ